MTYPAGEALILEQLKYVEGFNYVNICRTNWKKLNSGDSDHYAIVKPGAFAEDPTNNMSWINHTIIQVWQWYTDEDTTQSNLEKYVDAVKQRFTLYRKLGDTTGKIADSRVTGGA